MLTLYKPRFEDLWFRRMMLADEDTMSYNHAWGGTILWPQAEWGGWYERWVANPKDGRLYRYVKNSSGDFVGEIAYHFDADMQGFTANVIIFSKFRGRGYGGQALELLCAEAKSNGITIAMERYRFSESEKELALPLFRCLSPLWFTGVEQMKAAKGEDEIRAALDDAERALTLEIDFRSRMD